MRFATLLLLLLACDRQPGGDPSAPEGATPVLHGTVDLTIGGVDEARNAFIFGYVSSLALHPDGRILVADNSTNDIRVFGPDGSYQYTLGRPGAGPGDLNRPCCLAIAADGTLWARDVINRRYSVFALGKDGAEFIRSVRQRVENPRGFLDRVAWDWHGRIVDIGHLGNGLQRAFLDSAGSPVRWDSIPSSPAESLAVMRLERKTAGAVGGVAYYYHYQPHGPVELRALGPNGETAEAVSSRYAVSWLDAERNRLALLEATVAAPVLSEGERAAANQDLDELARDYGMARSSLAFGVPARKPILRGLYFDLDGRLWIERSVPDGQPRAADVYDREGHLVSTVTWPAHIRLHHGEVRGGTAVGVAVDSLGTNTVVRLLFR